MSLLRENRYPRASLSRPSRRAVSVRLPILVFLSLALLALSRLGNATVRELRVEAEALIAPALGAAMTPLGPLQRMAGQVQASYDRFSELERLRDENQRLKQWESRSRDLGRRVVELSKLAHALEETSIDYRTVRVIASSTGAFMQSALLDAGLEQGIKNGLPVIDADGVLGRIVEAGKRTSRVLLTTDINSRVPVLVGKAQVRAVLAGDNSPAPRLTFLPPDAVPNGLIETGAEITTSGLGGLFPQGLRIGAVSLSSDGLRARLSSDLGQLRYVSVLLYDNPDVALALELRQGQPETQSRRRAAAERASERPAKPGDGRP